MNHLLERSAEKGSIINLILKLLLNCVRLASCSASTSVTSDSVSRWTFSVLDYIKINPREDQQRASPPPDVETNLTQPQRNPFYRKEMDFEATSRIVFTLDVESDTRGWTREDDSSRLRFTALCLYFPWLYNSAQRLLIRWSTSTLIRD